MVVIVDANEIAKLKVASLRSSLRCNTFHSTSITKEHICIIIDQFIARLIEDSTRVSLSNGKTNSIAETLTKGASCNFHSWCIMLYDIRY